MQIGAYRVVGELGRGGAGVVYGGRAPDGREVAIKVLLAARPEALARFEREPRLLSSFGPAEGFVSLLDAGLEKDRPFVVMPLLRGGTLRDRLARGPLPIEATVALGKALARALGRAHERGIVHRDVKPENVLFDEAGHPFLADLGLAKHFSPDSGGASQSVSLSASGSFRGTAGYMPAEQLSDAKAVGPAADVFALGAVLYECLAGVPPFSGATLVELANAVVNGSVEPLGERRPDAPPWLREVVSRALARDPRERFGDGHAFAEALLARRPRRRSIGLGVGAALAALGGAGVVAYALRSPEVASRPPVSAPNPPASPAPSPSPAPFAPRERARRWALAAGAILPWLDGFEEETLAGHASAPEANETDRQKLQSSWRVVSRQGLVQQLTWLREEGDRALYEKLAASVAADPAAARATIERPGGDPVLAGRIRLVLERAAEIGTKSLVAWDQSRLIAVAGRGARAGLIAEDEAWVWIGPAARALQSTYGSWEELGEHFRIGRLFWKPTQPLRDDDTVSRLLREPRSPWKKYPWRTDLEAGSPWEGP